VVEDDDDDMVPAVLLALLESIESSDVDDAEPIALGSGGGCLQPGEGGVECSDDVTNGVVGLFAFSMTKNKVEVDDSLRTQQQQ
jgi:hypothetical protein